MVAGRAILAWIGADLLNAEGAWAGDGNVFAFASESGNFFLNLLAFPAAYLA
jgi:hypothetical protein